MGLPEDFKDFKERKQFDDNNRYNQKLWREHDVTGKTTAAPSVDRLVKHGRFDRSESEKKWEDHENKNRKRAVLYRVAIAPSHPLISFVSAPREHGEGGEEGEGVEW